MGRLFIGILIAAIIAALVFYFYSSGYRTQIDQQTQQISQLNDRHTAIKYFPLGLSQYSS